MRAAIVQQPGSLIVRTDLPKPEVGDYDVLCDLLYGATCTGTDQHLIEGRFPWPVSYPTVLGHESVGRVIAIGSKVRHFREGDLVSRVGMPPDPNGTYHVNWGGFADYGIAKDHWAMRADGLPASAWASYRVNQVIPADVDPRVATMIITWRETLSYLTRLGIRSGTTVLIVGSGGNGLSFASHALNAGADQVTMIGSASRKAAAHAAGVTTVVDYRDNDATAQAAAIVPKGYDIVIDAIGQAETADKVLSLIKPGGTLGIYGVDDLANCQIHPHHAQGSFSFYNGGYDEAEAHQKVIDMIRTRRLDAEIWLDLDHTYALDEIQSAFDAVRRRRFIKALVKLTLD